MSDVAEANPLKQGLKLTWDGRKLNSVNVEEANPLKQGLKHFYTEELM